MSSIQRLDVRTFLALIFALLCSAWATAAAPNNGYWQGFGGVPGCDGPVYASDALPNGDVIFGGEFSMCDNVAMNNIGVYSPTTRRWSRLGTSASNGTNGIVRSIAVSGNIAYVGGDFSLARQVAVANIAQVTLSTGTWANVGGGTNQNATVSALLVANGELYAGGNFLTMGGVTVNRIARWNGATWAALGTGVSGGPVRALATNGTVIYAGGEFTSAGIAGSISVAQWNGTGWAALGTGPGHPTRALAVFNNELYSGGTLTSNTSRLRRWNGSTWSGIEGFIGNINGLDVAALRTVGNTLYIGGYVLVQDSNGIIAWNGTNFAGLGLGVAGGKSDESCLTIVAAAGGVFCGGEFSEARQTANSAIRASNVAFFDSTQWQALGSGNGMSGTVHSLEVRGNTVYVGGSFRTAGSAFSPLVAAWTTAWSALLSDNANPQGVAYALDSTSADLFAGGLAAIGSAPQVNFQGAARFDGTTWLRMGAVASFAIVYAVAVDGSNVYAGGKFTSIAGVPANNIARWDGSAWNALGAGVNGTVRAIEPAIAGGAILVGGLFSQAGSVSANNIARWDGSATWSAVGAGVNGEVRAIQNLFLQTAVGGSFTSAGGVPANNIARLSGNTFAAAGAGTSGPVNALAPGPDGFYAGGEFTTAGGLVTNNIARWSNTPGDWGPLGFGTAVGTDRAVRALALDGTTLYVGGDFVKAGDFASAHIAQFVIDPMAIIRTGFEGD